MVVIRLKRIGKKHVPFYRIVVVDSRKKRDGAVIEEIGTYDPLAQPSKMQVASDRTQYWLSVGAQPSNTVQHILEILGEVPNEKGVKKNTYKEAEAKTPVEDILKEVANQAEEVKANFHKAKSAAKEEVKEDQEVANEVEEKIEEQIENQVEDSAAPEESTETPAPENNTESTEAPAEEKVEAEVEKAIEEATIETPLDDKQTDDTIIETGSENEQRAEE